MGSRCTIYSAVSTYSYVSMRHINQFGKNTAAGGALLTVKWYKFIFENMPERPSDLTTTINARFFFFLTKITTLLLRW